MMAKGKRNNIWSKSKITQNTALLTFFYISYFLKYDKQWPLVSLFLDMTMTYYM